MEKTRKYWEFPDGSLSSFEMVYDARVMRLNKEAGTIEITKERWDAFVLTKDVLPNLVKKLDILGERMTTKLLHKSNIYQMKTDDFGAILDKGKISVVKFDLTVQGLDKDVVMAYQTNRVQDVDTFKQRKYVLAVETFFEMFKAIENTFKDVSGSSLDILPNTDPVELAKDLTSMYKSINVNKHRKLAKVIPMDWQHKIEKYLPSNQTMFENDEVKG